MAKSKTQISGVALLVEIERSRLNRENAMVVMNKGFLMFFVFLFAAVMGYTRGFVSSASLSLMIVVGLGIFILVSVHELHIMVREENRLQRHINQRLRQDTK